MAIPPEKIEEIRNYVDIVNVVSEYVKLKKSGKNYFGLCPFHHEKTPSFSVNPEKQIFHCFGCGEGGNVYTFLMKVGNLSFVEAVETLANRVGIKIDKYVKKDKKDIKKENLYSVNEYAAKLYFRQLKFDAGKEAYEYLKSRGFDDNTIKNFGIGYAPDEWDYLIKYAKKEGISVDTLVKCGLVIYNEKKNSYYDRFRNRIIFPIVSEFGRVIAFGARTLSDNTDQPKYINSPETVIYKKGKTLYGLYQNRKKIREGNFALLVEGYTDVISLYQHGIDFSAASLGTSLTEEQSRLLSRYTENIGILYDADEAGTKAAFRGADILLNSNLDVSIIPLSGGEDPDSFVRKHGRDQFIINIGKKIPFLDFYFEKKLENKDKLSTTEKINCAKEIIEIISKIKNDLKRDILLDELSRKLGVSKDILYPEVQREMKARRSYPGTAEKEPGFYRIDPKGTELLSFAILYKNVFEFFYNNLEEDFSIFRETRDLIEIISDYYKDNNELNISKLYDYTSEKYNKNLSELTDKIPKIPKDMSEEEFQEYCMQTVKQAIKMQKLERIQKKIRDLKSELSKYSATSEEASQISHKIFNIEKEKKSLIEE